MCFLGGRSVVAGDDEIDSGESPGLAAAAAEEGYAGQAEALRFGEGGENVGGVAARGEDDQQVAGTGEAGDLARERVFVAVIVADAGEQRAVGGKGDRGERAAILGVATDKFGGEMGGLGGAAAVAADEQFSAAAEGLENEAGRRVDLGLDPRQRVERGVGLREGGGQIHEGKVASSPRRVASRKTAQTMLATRCPVSSNFASMRLRTLTLRHFRNVAFARIECEGKRQFFVGANGQGKTNLLEAAGFLTAARSFRTTDSATLLMHGQTTAAVACTVEHPQLGETQITIKVHRHNKEIWCDQARVVRLVDYLGKFPTVVFSSQDLQLVRGAPAARRRWLDLTLAASRRAAAEEVVENLRGPDGNLRRYRERKKFREPDQRPPVRQDRSDRFWIRAQKEVMKLLPSLSQSTLSRRLALFEEWLEDFAEEGDSNQ